MKVTSVLLCILMISGCAGMHAVPPVASTPAPATAPPSLPDSVHWYRDSAEQKAVYIETYRAAAAAARTLSKGLPPRSWGVILDVDETVLDNSDYQKRVSLAGKTFEIDTWNAWIDERQATALPGAREFTGIVRDELKGHVILVTNRTQQQCPATEDNLRARHIPYDRVLCDRGGGDKNPRFQAVIKGDGGVPPLNVLIWVGDNIQDFPSLSQTNAEGSERFGASYFVLPNPMYGSWTKNPPR